jgi:hypothetical protein
VWEHVWEWVKEKESLYLEVQQLNEYELDPKKIRD